jgi:hypothetical protein
MRFAVSLIAVSAWLAASNHCAIGATVPTQLAKAPTHPGCPGHSAPKKDGKSSEMECCQSFPPAAADAGKTVVSYDSHNFALRLYFVTALLAPQGPDRDLRPLELDTGPPRAPWFVASVLQRSIPAHAPPYVA